MVKESNKSRKLLEKIAGLPSVLKGLIDQMDACFHVVDWSSEIPSEKFELLRSKYVELKVKILKWAIKNNDNDAGKEVFKLLFMPRSAGIQFGLSLENIMKCLNLELN